MKNKYEIDMCNGPLFGKILLFTIPLILSGILQLLFNAVDMVVVGRYCGEEALAAVGSTGSLVNLLTNLFMGLSIGANVLVARLYGAKKMQELELTVQTSMYSSVFMGILLAIIGVLAARPLLLWMGSPENVIEQSALYVKIYFCGMPVILLYNYGAAILRAVGDTKRPLLFLTIAGVVNASLNLLFVIVFQMGVAGVALATIISQAISAALVVWVLASGKSSIQFNIRKLEWKWEYFVQILRIGIPAGLQGSLFALSNVLIQSSINSFGSVAMAGNSAASNIEGFIYTSMNAFQQTSTSFTSQNMGGGKYKRVNKVLVYCLLGVTVLGCTLGFTAYFFGETLLSLYNDNAEVIQFGLERMSVICVTYALCGIMDTLVGAIRGLGSSVLPMIVSLLGACGFRILWIATIFAEHRTLLILYISYPVSWILTSAVHVICFFVVRKKVFPKK